MQIYLDMDQTLTNWEKGVLDYLDLPPVPDEREFDAWLQQQGVTVAALWARIGNDAKFWRTLPSLPSAKRLVNRLKSVGKVRILSSCGRKLNCIAQAKEEWLASQGIDSVLIPLREKFLLAQSHRVLVDDNVDNCEEWVAAGGVGIVFPSRPYNPDVSHDAAVTWCLSTLKEIVSDDVSSGIRKKGT